MKARWKQNCIGPAYVNVYAEAIGGLGACYLRKRFFESCCEMASEAILGPKTSLLIFALVLAW